MSRKKSDLEDLPFWFGIGVDLKGRHLFLEGEIDGDMAATASKAVLLLQSINTDPIQITINSVGGEIVHGLALYDLLRASPCEINMHGTGQVASMALIVFMAGDVRTCSKHCVFMNHAGNGNFDGKPYQIETEFQIFKLREDWCSRILADRSNRPADYWTHSAQFKDIYYDRDSAYEVGILTEKI